MLTPREWVPVISQTTTHYIDTSTGQPSDLELVTLATLFTQWTRTDDSEWLGPEREIVNILRSLFRQIPEVSSICVRFEEDTISVWTLLQSYDRGAREKVYEKELELCELLKIHDFDFRVTSKELMSPEELVAAGSREIFSRNQ